MKNCTMTNQELVAILAKRLKLTQRETSDVLDSFITIFNSHLEKGDSVNIQGFGLFETKKRKERVSVNPVTKQKYLIPPKISVGFKPGQTIKDNLKNLEVDE